MRMPEHGVDLITDAEFDSPERVAELRSPGPFQVRAADRRTAGGDGHPWSLPGRRLPLCSKARVVRRAHARNGGIACAERNQQRRRGGGRPGRGVETVSRHRIVREFGMQNQRFHRCRCRRRRLCSRRGGNHWMQVREQFLVGVAE